MIIKSAQRGLLFSHVVKRYYPNIYYMLFFSDMVIYQCNEMMVGAHYPALRVDQVNRIKIPLPPIEEQKRIVSRLEQLVSRAEEEGWKWIKLESVAEIVMGRSPPSTTYNKERIGLPFYQGKMDFGEKIKLVALDNLVNNFELGCKVTSLNS